MSKGLKHVKKKHIKILVIGTSALVVAVLAFVIITVLTAENSQNILSNTDAAIAANTETDDIQLPSTDAEATIDTLVISSSLVEIDYEFLSTKSMLVICGKVVDQSEAFQIIPVFGGEPMNYTDYYLEVADVLRGNTDLNKTIIVRVRGGLVNDVEIIDYEAAKFNLNDQILVFLYQPNMGSAYNTKGDYYYVLGDTQGVFYPESSNSDLFTNEYGMSIKWTQAIADFEEINNINPVDEFWIYNEFLDNQKRNLDNGSITQEEYDMFVEEGRQYATIVE